MIIGLAIVALLVTMGLALIRAIQGPTVYDRILAANTFNTKTVLMIAALGVDFNEWSWIPTAGIGHGS